MFPKLQQTYGFTQQDLEAFHKHFKRLDRDGDGHISHNELKNHFKDMGVRVTARTLTDLIYEIDANRNGQVEFEEFVMLMYRMKKGGSTNWKQLLDFTKPIDRTATIARRAGRETLRFLGATPANDFDQDQQWQEYSFFQRVDNPPAEESRARNFVRSLNPFNRSSSRDENPAGPSGSSNDNGGPPRLLATNRGGREVIEVTVLRDDDDDDVDFQSDSSYEYYSDSDDEAPAAGPQAQRSSRVVRPLSNLFTNPPPSAPVLEPTTPSNDALPSGANVAAASSTQVIPTSSAPPAAETAEEAEYRIYQEQRRRQMEQHQVIQNNLANRRRELAQSNGRPLSVASAEIPLLQLSSHMNQYSPSSSPMRGSPVAAVGGHGGFVDDTDDFIAEPPSAANANPRNFSRRPLSQASFEGSRPSSPRAGSPSPAQRPLSPRPSTFYPVIPTPAAASPVDISPPVPAPSHPNTPAQPPTAEEAEDLSTEAHRGRRRRRRRANGTVRRPPVENRTQPQRRTTIKRSRSERVDLVLQDPKVRQQLRKKKQYRPWFMLVVILVQLGLMAYALILNQGFESMTVNPFGGPSVSVVLQLGAKYGPCMRAPTASVLQDFGVSNFTDLVDCPAGFPGTVTDGKCPLNEMLEYVCGMGGFPDGVPLQWWRFFTAIFMHTGLIHLGVIVFFQLRIGFPLEQEVGPIRIFFIYILSGVLGNAFAANMSPLGLTCGASGALFGLFALLFIDLFQNWPLLTMPWINLATLGTICLIILGVGLLPFIDNYAQLGGLAGGLLTGLIFMPTITFGLWDGRRKIILMGVAGVVLVLLLFAGFYTFYDANETNYCEYCSYLDCVPPGVSWCQASGMF